MGVAARNRDQAAVPFNGAADLQLDCAPLSSLARHARGQFNAAGIAALRPAGAELQRARLALHARLRGFYVNASGVALGGVPARQSY